jgi:hypothetical protein
MGLPESMPCASNMAQNLPIPVLEILVWIESLYIGLDNPMAVPSNSRNAFSKGLFLERSSHESTD